MVTHVPKLRAWLVKTASFGLRIRATAKRFVYNIYIYVCAHVALLLRINPAPPKEPQVTPNNEWMLLRILNSCWPAPWPAPVGRPMARLRSWQAQGPQRSSRNLGGEDPQLGPPGPAMT